MRREAKKYKSRNAEYTRKRAAYLSGRKCALCNKVRAEEVHHIAGRNAKARDSIAEKYESVANYLAVCRRCHNVVDKESPALYATAAKLILGELDLALLKELKTGRRFSITYAELERAVEDVYEYRNLVK